MERGSCGYSLGSCCSADPAGPGWDGDRPLWTALAPVNLARWPRPESLLVSGLSQWMGCADAAGAVGGQSHSGRRAATPSPPLMVRPWSVASWRPCSITSNNHLQQQARRVIEGSREALSNAVRHRYWGARERAVRQKPGSCLFGGRPGGRHEERTQPGRELSRDIFLP
jgi:hypothetical protein